jgi:purine-binding chemotaxis protein CheW
MSHEEASTVGPNGQQYCTFRVDHLLIGVEVWRVQEVIRHQPMTLVPLGAPEVRGLINLRGQIVTTIDVRRWLHLRPAPEDSTPMNAVLRLDDEAVSLLVDEAGEVVTPAKEAFEPVPPTVSERIRSLFSGTYKLPNSLLLVLDTDAIATIGHERFEGLRRSA